VIGASKPSPIIYREALRACRARAEEAVYVDDIEGYVDARAATGDDGRTLSVCRAIEIRPQASTGPLKARYVSVLPRQTDAGA